MKKIVFSSFLIFGLLLFIQINSFACSCDLPFPKRSIKKMVNKALKSSTAVFSGTVLEITKEPQNFYVSVRLQIDNSWKGPSTKEIIISTGLGNGDCGFHFEVGKSYLIYTYGSNENKLSTNMCQRTTNLFFQSTEDLKFLGKGKFPERKKVKS